MVAEVLEKEMILKILTATEMTAHIRNKLERRRCKKKNKR